MNFLRILSDFSLLKTNIQFVVLLLVASRLFKSQSLKTTIQSIFSFSSDGLYAGQPFFIFRDKSGLFVFQHLLNSSYINDYQSYRLKNLNSIIQPSHKVY